MARLCVKDAVYLFLTAMQAARNAGQLSPPTYTKYLQTGKLCSEFFGRVTAVDDLAPADFAAYKAKLDGENMNIVSMGSHINLVRILFKRVADNDYIDRPREVWARFEATLGKASSQA